MDTSSPPKEVEKAISPESKSQDEENEQKSTPTDSICSSNAEKPNTEDLHKRNVGTDGVSKEESTPISTETEKAGPAAADNVPENKDEPQAKDSVQTEEQITASAADTQLNKDSAAPVQLDNAAQSDSAPQSTVELMETGDDHSTTAPEKKDEALPGDSVETEQQIAASADSQTNKDQHSASVQLETASESESSQQKGHELMETGDVHSTTEVEANAVEDVAVEEPQSATDATVAAESVSQSNQEPQQPSVATETVDLSGESATVNIEVIDISEASETQNEPPTAAKSGQPGSLSLLAEMYDSGNDSDVCEVPSMTNYQNRVVEIDSDTESSSSSSEDEADNEPIDVDLLSAVHADDDEEEGVRSSRSPRVKGEFHLDDLPPIHELQITVPEEECTELGKVQSVIEQLVLVNSLPGTVPLDLETVLFLDKGKKVLGEIFDVLGQVSDPLYCVRFNSNKDIKAKGIEVGQTVYVAPRTQHTQFVILANLMKDRGSDASWEYDVEPPERYLDYSDDEEERAARRTVRNRNRPMEAIDEGPKRSRPADAPSPSGSRPYRGNHYGDGPRMPHYPNNYRIAGNSWHSNFPQNYNPQPQYSQYRPPPMHYRPPARGMPHRPPGHHPGMVVNPYAMYPPPHLMQQPLFPPPTHQPPPPGPPGPHGGY